MSTFKIKISKNSQPKLISDGFFLYKNCLDEQGQIAFLDACTLLMEQKNNSQLISTISEQNYKFAQPVLFYNWPGQPESLKNIVTARPSDILRLGDEIHQTGCREQAERKLGNELSLCKIPEQFTPYSLYGILYQPGSGFGAHQDGANGWTIALSLGADADFFYFSLESSKKISQRINEYEESEGKRADRNIIREFSKLEPESEKRHVRISSGDAILFNGGQIFHGVSKVYSETPEFWKDSVFDRHGMSRFNLQFRDTFRDNLTYYPFFEHEN
ncbi:alpha-ketoglutarate-dependent dioxygenase AlkB [Endozoicomonas sp.]|uniref:alpha-ketoglutarate-dependent dioxygenase AlkB n=1 Tax=Endozoicomonas sp. TaxID=1892382 RepID=UPI0028835966|nr:alpha-ketoglutarate-dependent dioxygenase AlkB [Endozoicomonas sp.]